MPLPTGFILGSVELVALSETDPPAARAPPYCASVFPMVASPDCIQAGWARPEHLHSAKGLQLTAELLRIDAQAPEQHVLRYAADFLVRGRVVAVPTDTVYGLAADPFNLSAIAAIYRAKGRPESRALPILVNSVEQAMLLSREVPANFLKLAHEFWPGELTLVVDAAHRLPLKVTGNTGRVALRWPRSAVISGLIEEFGAPITGTSANISGYPSCVSGAQVLEQLGARLPLILDVGDLGSNLASTIVVLHDDSWKVVREGIIPTADIAKYLA